MNVRCLAGKGDIQPQLESAVQDVTDKYLLLEETEKQAVRKALIEERARFCIFVSMLRPVVVRSGVKEEVDVAVSRLSRVPVLTRLCVSGRGDGHAG